MLNLLNQRVNLVLLNKRRSKLEINNGKLIAVELNTRIYRLETIAINNLTDFTITEYLINKAYSYIYRMLLSLRKRLSYLNSIAGDEVTVQIKKYDIALINAVHEGVSEANANQYHEIFDALFEYQWPDNTCEELEDFYDDLTTEINNWLSILQILVQEDTPLEELKFKLDEFETYFPNAIEKIANKLKELNLVVVKATPVVNVDGSNVVKLNFKKE